MSRRDPYGPTFDSKQYHFLLLLIVLMLIATLIHEFPAAVRAQITRATQVGHAYSSHDLAAIEAVEADQP